MKREDDLVGGSTKVALDELVDNDCAELVSKRRRAYSIALTGNV